MTEIVNLWDGRDADKNYDTEIQFDRLEDEGLWQFSLENGPFSGYPAIKLGRKDLKDLYEVLEQELYPERFRRHWTPPAPKESERVLRLKAGNYQFGCSGRHVGNGSDCSTTPHHHHDEFCDPPTIAELNEAGVDPLVFRKGYYQQRLDSEKAYRDLYNETGLA